LRVSFSCLAVLVSACGSATATDAGLVLTPQTTLAVLVEETGIDPAITDVGQVPEAAVFLAAVDEGLAGTSYEGDAFVDPEAYLGTAVLFCELLENGLSGEEVLTAYILALSEASGGGDIPSDDLLLGGVILGAGVQTLCPEFIGAVDGGS
jgi:hypothetical protein